MKRPVFVCEDQKGGADFLKHCIQKLVGESTPIMKGQGVSELPKMVTLAQKRHRDAKIIVLADSDALAKHPKLRSSLRTALAGLGAVGILVNGNVEALARRCIPESSRPDFDKERKKSKDAATAFARNTLDWALVETQAEMIDIGAVAKCNPPTLSI